MAPSLSSRNIYAFMRHTVHVVSSDDYAAWLDKQRQPAQAPARRAVGMDVVRALGAE